MAYKYQTFPDSLQMIGNTSLLDRPDKVAFLSSRRISPAAVLKCYYRVLDGKMAETPKPHVRRMHEIDQMQVAGK